MVNELTKSNELRLHMDDITPRYMPNEPDIEMALKHHTAFNSLPHTWAALEISQFKHERLVVLHIGAIMSDGTKERPIVSRHYSIRDGKGEYIVMVHP